MLCTSATAAALNNVNSNPIHGRMPGALEKIMGGLQKILRYQHCASHLTRQALGH